jgi:hypothetical protein
MQVPQPYCVVSEQSGMKPASSKPYGLHDAAACKHPKELGVPQHDQQSVASTTVQVLTSSLALHLLRRGSGFM